MLDLPQNVPDVVPDTALTQGAGGSALLDGHSLASEVAVLSQIELISRFELVLGALAVGTV